LEWELLNPNIKFELIRIKQLIYIFKKDVIGNLKGDYDKNNKRYRKKWIDEKYKIDKLKDELIEIWNVNN